MPELSPKTRTVIGIIAMIVAIGNLAIKVIQGGAIESGDLIAIVAAATPSASRFTGGK